MSFRSIRETQQIIWPTVQESLARHRASRALLADDPNPTSSALRRARKPMERVAAEEAVWAMARADLLVSPAHAAVIQAAREWVKSYDGLSPSLEDGDYAQDIALYRAVQTLATEEIDMPDEEPLTGS